MKRILSYTALIILFGSQFLFSQSSSNVFVGCATDVLMNKNPRLLQLQKTIDSSAYNFFTSRRIRLRSNVTYTIPVVVHIIHNGGSENISDVQVQNAIANINAKYAQSTGDQIQFCLAQRDPAGNATNGITRNQSTLTTETMEDDDLSLKNIIRWNPNCYMNIWVVKEILSNSQGSGVVGYAYFPSAHGSNIDGLVIEANYFGSTSQNDAVGAHEVGHYFGLYHTFQNGCTNNNCLLDGDQVCDTPPDRTTFASCNPPSNSCSTDANDVSVNNPYTTDVSDDSQDYMDYSSISCYDHFTGGQYNRMLYFLTNTRSSLLNCQSCSPPCATPIIANITSPAAPINVTRYGTVNFTATVANSNNYQWYINTGNVLSTNLSTSISFNNNGNYWVKFKVLSNNPALCSDAIDSVHISVSDNLIRLDSGLVACYPFNGNAVDESGNNNNAVSNSATLTTNRYSNNNSAYTFDGANDSIDIGNDPSLKMTSGISISMWFNVHTFSPVYQNLISDHAPNETTVGSGKILRFNYSTLQFIVGGIFGQGSGQLVQANNITLNQWTNAIATYDMDSIRLYINGVLADAQPYSNSIVANPNDLLIGKSGFGEFFNGEIDDIRIYNRSLQREEVISLYNGNGQCCTIPVIKIDPGDFTYCGQSSCIAGAWNQLASGVSNTINFIDNASECTIYAVGENSTIIKSIDKGITWTPQNSGTTATSLRSVAFANADTGYVVGLSNVILKTTNGGAVWNRLPQPNYPNANWNNIWLFDANTMIIVGNDNGYQYPLLLKSVDGGNSWVSMTTGALSSIYGIFFKDDLNGFISTNFGNILKTTDGGVTWTTQLSNPQTNASPQLLSIFFPDNNTGYSVGGRTPGNGVVYKTTDGGNSWASIYTDASLYFVGVEFTDINTGYVSGGNIGANTGTILKTINGGSSWTTINTGSARLGRMNLRNLNSEFAVGLNGTILKLCERDSIRLKASGGTSYVWSNGATTNVITVKPSQTTTYSVVSASLGCTGSAATTITIPTLTVNSVTVCTGQMATLTATGGSNYHWSTGATTQSITITGAGVASSYTVTSNFGCCSASAVATVYINNLISPVLNLGNDISLCVSGIRTFDAGAGFKEYRWNDGNTNQVYTAYTPGKHWVTVVGYCDDVQSDTIEIIQAPAPLLNLRNDTALCPNDSVLLTYQSDSTFSTFQWYPVSGLSCTTCPTPEAKPLATTKYYLTATTASGCVNIDSVSIILNPLYTPSLGNDIYLCPSQKYTFDAGEGFKQYLWNDNSTNQTLMISDTGKYWVTVKNYCDTLLSLSDTVYVHRAQQPLLDLGSDVILCQGKSLTLTYASDSTFTSFQWSPDVELSCINCANPVAHPSTDIKYYLYAKTANGCYNNDSITINIIGTNTNFEIANVFSPNNDNVNDVFKVNSQDSFNCKIYNRWGVLVTEFTNVNNGWNGKSAKGVDYPDGVYFYVITITDECGSLITKKGYLHLVR